MSGVRWYALVGHEVVGPFDTADVWYHRHGGPDWRAQEWERSGHDPWCVERTDLGDGREVSTVFLGLDHWWVGDEEDSNPPAVFETMILPDCTGPWRYATWDQAAAGHWQIVAEQVTADAT